MLGERGGRLTPSGAVPEGPGPPAPRGRLVHAGMDKIYFTNIVSLNGFAERISGSPTGVAPGRNLNSICRFGRAAHPSHHPIWPRAGQGEASLGGRRMGILR